MAVASPESVPIHFMDGEVLLSSGQRCSAMLQKVIGLNPQCASQQMKFLSVSPAVNDYLHQIREA